MGLFKKLIKKTNKNIIPNEENLLFVMDILLKERCNMPSFEKINEVINKYFGEVKYVQNDLNGISFLVLKYQKNENGKNPICPILCLSNYISNDDFVIDDFTKSQMFDCPRNEEILSNCKYRITANDMMTFGLSYKERTEMLMDYMEVLKELFPQLEALYFRYTGKLIGKENLFKNVPKEEKFIYYVLKIRYFNVEDSDDIVIDTLGMGILEMPDLQCHFHDLDENLIMDYLYNIAMDLYCKGNQLENNDFICGLLNDELTDKVKWSCHYENSLVKPSRIVIDIDTGKYAAGKRK